jgi:hypothetical protein
MEQLELLGKEIIENLRDASIEEYLSIKNGKMNSLDAQNIHKIYSSLDDKSRESADTIVFNIIDRVLHNALWMLQQSSRFTITDKNLVNPDDDLIELSDGISGELYTEHGWIHKYSKYPSGTI